jgi:hypothetical protein
MPPQYHLPITKCVSRRTPSCFKNGKFDHLAIGAVLHKIVHTSERFFRNLQRRVGPPISGGLSFALLTVSGYRGEGTVLDNQWFGN